MKKVSIYTDGACSGNPGKGGWGAVLVYNGTEKEMSGFEAETTNNRMELTAVIRALAALREPCLVTLQICVRRGNQGLGLRLAAQGLAQGRRQTGAEC